MHCEHEDDKLTAFALGELDADDAVGVGAHVAGCPACQRTVEEIRALGDRLTAELAQEPTPVKAEVLVLPDPPDRGWFLPISPESRRRRNRRAVGVLIAASLLIGTTALLLLPAQQGGRESGRVEHQLLAEFRLDSDEVPNQVLEEEIRPSESLDLASSRIATPHSFQASQPLPHGKAAPHQNGSTADVGLADVFSTSGTVLSTELPEGQAGDPGVIGVGVEPARDRRPGPWWQKDEGRYVAPGTDFKLSREAAAAQAKKNAQDGSNQNSAIPFSQNSFRTVTPVPAALATNQPNFGLPQSPPVNELGSPPLAKSERDFNTEAYARVTDNPFRLVRDEPLSTFSIDVDTASYSNARRFITSGSRPPPDAVRIEELLNYFSYDYAPPTDDKPFAAHMEVAECPWQSEHRLLRVGLKGRVIAHDDRPAANLVFLLDVSGSMQPPNKLPLVRQAMKLLVERLDRKDRVAIAVYAGASGLVLPSTSCEQKETIVSAIDNLQAGGSTNGASGIELAYQVAQQNFIKQGTNRVILCTDGDFNVGVTDQGSLSRLIEEKAKAGVFLSVLGFGMGNFKDSTLEMLADRGNGNYAYVDTFSEARKVLVEQMSGTLVTIAKDVKIQIEFNPAQVASYRLVGYENRMLAKEDFNDDKKDAGEIGAGHTVTALYELVPAGSAEAKSKVDPLKYQPAAQVEARPVNPELLTLKLRYKQPDGDTSKLMEQSLTDAGHKLPQASDDFRFAAAVAEFGMLLRGSPDKGTSAYANVLDLAGGALGDDKSGYRAEFIKLVEHAQRLP